MEDGRTIDACKTSFPENTGKFECFPAPASQRDLVVAEARKWIKTPYHSNGDILGVGVDCGMILVRVFVDCGLVKPFDPRPYPRDWHLHRSEERYLGIVKRFAHEIEQTQAEAGDIAVFKYGRCYSHGAIITKGSPLTIIHAFGPYGFVVEEPVSANPDLVSHSPRFFSIWAV